jgi:hypothetical protein
MASTTSLLGLIERFGIPGLLPEATGLVSKFGRSFVGADRPKVIRKRTPKECFLNSATLASDETGFYCEGAALKVGETVPFHHAWVTRDDRHVIDVTLVDPESYLFFGVIFPSPIFAEIFLSHVDARRVFRPFFSAPLNSKILQRLEESASRSA